MANRQDITFVKTYATPDNAEKAVTKLLGEGHQARESSLRYTILPVETEGGIRYGVLFIGMPAIEEGIHFHFNCIA